MLRRAGGERVGCVEERFQHLLCGKMHAAHRFRNHAILTPFFIFRFIASRDAVGIADQDISRLHGEDALLITGFRQQSYSGAAFFETKDFAGSHVVSQFDKADHRCIAGGRFLGFALARRLP